MVRFGVPGQNVNSLAYADERLSVVPVVHAPREPTTSDKKFPMWCEWRISKSPSSGAEGDFWKLVKFESNGNATWVKFSPSAGTSFTGLRDQVNANVDPNGATQRIDIDGLVVSSGGNPSSIPLESVAGTNVLTMQLQVTKVRSGAPGNKNDAGIASFETTQFVVDTDGYVTLKGSGGGAPILKLKADDTNSASPDATGLITITGTTVANGTRAKPLFTEAATANVVDIEIQVGKAETVPANKNGAGLLSMDSAQFTVDSNGWTTATYGAGPSLGVQNLGFSYNAGTGVFTVHGFDGTALSSTNPAYVTLPSTTAGYTITKKVTANQSFIDDVGASQIIGNLFGMTTGIAVTVDVPFFLYACINDAQDTITFGISRVPNLVVAPATANIGTPSAANADVQYGIFMFNSVTVGDYDGNPVLCIGSFRMTMSASDDWTVSTLVVGRDSIGKFQETSQFSFPRGQFGAATGKIFQDNGGTAPDDSDQGMAYYVSKTGECNIRLGWPSIDVAGVGAVNAILTLPYVCQNGGTGLFGRFLSGAAVMSILVADTNPSTQQTAIFAYANSAADGTALNTFFSAGGALSLNGQIFMYRG